jgi:hypothetical protein
MISLLTTLLLACVQPESTSPLLPAEEAGHQPGPPVVVPEAPVHSLEGRGRMPWGIEQMVSVRGQAPEAPITEDLARLRSLPPEEGDLLLGMISTRGEATSAASGGGAPATLRWPPAPEGGGVVLEGSLDLEATRAVLEHQTAALRRCTLAYPWPGDAAPSAMVVGLELRVDGLVRLARILEGALPSEQLERCIAAVLASPRYPPPDKAPAVLLVPVAFEASGFGERLP